MEKVLYAVAEFASKTDVHLKNNDHRVFSRNDDAVCETNIKQVETCAQKKSQGRRGGREE